MVRADNVVIDPHEFCEAKENFIIKFSTSVRDQKNHRTQRAYPLVKDGLSRRGC